MGGVGWHALSDMLRWTNQPIRYAEPFYGWTEDYQFSGAVLTLTDFGRLLLEDKADAVAFCGVDRWVGGVHLQGQHVPWRWERESARLVSCGVQE